MSSFLKEIMNIPQIDLITEGFAVSIQLMSPGIRLVIYDQDNYNMLFSKLFSSSTTLTEFADLLDKKLQELTNESYEKSRLANEEYLNSPDGF